MGAADVLIGIVPVILAVAFILLIARSMGDRSTGMVDRMKQAVGGTVMLLVALMVVFAFTGGGGDSPTPGPDPDPDPEPEPDGAMDPALFTFSVADGQATITGWAGEEPAAGYDLILPTTDGDGHPVVAVDETFDQETFVSFFSGAASLSGESIITIGDGCFVETPLTSVSLPAAETIGFYAFGGCTALASVSIPAAETILDSAFAGCESLTSISLPAAKTIGEMAFSRGTALTSVSIPVAETIGSSAFAEIPLTSVSLPAATSFGDYAFGGCTSLVSVSIPVAEDTGTALFAGCTSLTSISLPAAKTIGERAFANCNALESVSAPVVENIGYRAFYGCTGTTSVTFGPLTGTIGNQAFNSWTFYDTDGTTVLSKTAANLADSTFEGVYNALVKVDSNRGLTPEMEQRVLELSAENSLKASMLAELDPELADMDPSDVARMTVSEIESMTADDVRAIKSSLPSRSG